MVKINLRFFGGRGSFSCLERTLDDVLDFRGGGTVEEIEHSQFGRLQDAENIIRKKRYETLIVYNQEGQAIKAYKGNSHSVSFPDLEAKKWEGHTVTHNHPKGMEGFGGTFSMADMRNATVYRFGSHRAVGSGQGEKNYILTAGKNANYMGLNKRLADDITNLRTKMHEEIQKVRLEHKAGNYKNYAHAVHVGRQKSVGILNSYYRKVAEEYGFIYRTQK